MVLGRRIIHEITAECDNIIMIKSKGKSLIGHKSEGEDDDSE